MRLMVFFARLAAGMQGFVPFTRVSEPVSARILCQRRAIQPLASRSLRRSPGVIADLPSSCDKEADRATAGVSQHEVLYSCRPWSNKPICVHAPLFNRRLGCTMCFGEVASIEMVLFVRSLLSQPHHDPSKPPIYNSTLPAIIQRLRAVPAGASHHLNPHYD
jgi:hypothetical protein